MLQIHKQAITEQDAEAILDASYLVRKPFGVPVMFVDPQDYKPKKFFGIPLPRLMSKHRIATQLQNTVMQCDPPSPSLSMGRLRRMIEDRGYSEDTGQLVQDEIMNALTDYRRDHNPYMASAYALAEPRMAIVFHARIPNVAEAEAADTLHLDPQNLPPLPGHNAEHHFITLWHEIAHSIAGFNEAGADYTSAMMYRHAFANPRLLNYQGDLRAANMVFIHQSRPALEDYGWSCVEAFDRVAAMKARPSREDVYQAGCQSYDYPTRPRVEAIQAVGKKLSAQFTQAYCNRDLAALAEGAAGLAVSGTLLTSDEIAIARRFAVAVRRLSIGRDAY